MTIQTNTANRKVLAEHISRLIGEPCRYLRVPSCAYQVGPYTINRDGSISGEDLETLRGFLRENGYIPNEEQPAEEATQLPENRSADEPSDSEADRIPYMDISIPARDITPAQLKNLVFMLYSRQTLLNRMTGCDCLSIPDSLIEKLREGTPNTMEDFTGLLEVSRSEAGLSGFDYRDGKVTMAFPFDETQPGHWTAYANLLNRIYDAAVKATRVFPERVEPDSQNSC